jgi:hypothetical protein
MARKCKCLVAFENVWTNNQAHFKAFGGLPGSFGDIRAIHNEKARGGMISTVGFENVRQFNVLDPTYRLKPRHPPINPRP